MSTAYDPIYNPDLNTQRDTTIHGVLMAIAVILLFPAAILLARHRQLYKQTKIGGLDKWFVLHRSLNMSGMAFFIAGFILAWVTLPVNPMPYKNVGVAHKAMGIATLALLVLQVLFAIFLRPAPDAPRRWAFNLGHHNLGRLAMVVGWIALYLGIVTHHAPLYQQSALNAHAAAFAAITGLWFLLDLYLTLRGKKYVEPTEPTLLEEGLCSQQGAELTSKKMVVPVVVKG